MSELWFCTCVPWKAVNRLEVRSRVDEMISPLSKRWLIAVSAHENSCSARQTKWVLCSSLRKEIRACGVRALNFTTSFFRTSAIEEIASFAMKLSRQRDSRSASTVSCLVGESHSRLMMETILGRTIHQSNCQRRNLEQVLLRCLQNRWLFLWKKGWFELHRCHNHGPICLKIA